MNRICLKYLFILIFLFIFTTIYNTTLCLVSIFIFENTPLSFYEFILGWLTTSEFIKKINNMNMSTIDNDNKMTLVGMIKLWLTGLMGVTDEVWAPNKALSCVWTRR